MEADIQVTDKELGYGKALVGWGIESQRSVHSLEINDDGVDIDDRQTEGFAHWKSETADWIMREKTEELVHWKGDVGIDPSTALEYYFV